MTKFSEDKFWKKVFKQAKATRYQVVKKVLLIFYAFILSFAVLSCSDDKTPPTGPASAGKTNSSASASEDQSDTPVVRFFYFYSDKYPFRVEMLAAIKAGILRVQAVYAEQMESLGYSPFFRFEIDEQGDPVVELVEDQNSDALPHNEVWELVSDDVGEPEGVNYVFYEADQPEGITLYYAKNKGLGYHGDRWEVWAGDGIWEGSVAGPNGLAYLLPDSRDSGSAVEAPDSEAPDGSLSLIDFLGIGTYQAPDGSGSHTAPEPDNPPNAGLGELPSRDLFELGGSTVQFIYFYSENYPFSAAVLDSMKTGILRIQAFYAEQMQAHGYGYRTFHFETDEQDDPVVNLVEDRNGNEESDEVRELFKINPTTGGIEGIYSIFYEDGSGRSRGIANSYGKNAGLAYVQGRWDWETAAHELGHLFGLLHDFRDDSYLMSYGRNRHALSACSAEFLAVNPCLNADIPLEEGSSPTVELISPATYPVGSESVSVQIKVRDPEGIHQVFFLTGDIYSKKVKACRGLAGEKEAIVEFEYDGKRFPSDTRNLSDPVVHPIRFYAVDLEGNWGGLHEDFSLMQR